MSLSEWLNTTVGNHPAGSRPQDANPPAQTHDAPDVSDIHQRLDSLTRQIDQISRPAPGSSEASSAETQGGEPAVARQLNDAISRLDARLSKISDPSSARQAQPTAASLDFAIAEITARQSELQTGAQTPPPRSAPIAAAPLPDISGLERHFSKINSRLDELQRPDSIEQSIAAFRGELAEIRHAITEAMPRRAIESIENEIRSLAQRIDDTRQNGMNGQALIGVERALGEIREALRALTSAEQLAGFDDTVRNLGSKVDLILRANGDPNIIGQLEGTITALRSMVSNVASNEALARLSDEVHSLSSKVDQFAFSEGHGDSFAALEQRIAALTSTLETHERPAVSQGSEQLEGALRALSDRLDHFPAGGAGGDNLSAFAHLEQRVSYLLERLEISTEPRGSQFERIEEGLQAVLRQLEIQHAGFSAAPVSGRTEADSSDNDLIKRELSDLRLGQSETGRQTQDSLEIVHNTLGHVVDRLAVIEGDLRTVRVAPVSQATSQQYAAPGIEAAQQLRPELPNPAAAQTRFAAAPREFHAAQPAAVSAAAMAPRAISEILDSHAAQHQRPAIDPDLPPDHPLEPGTRPVARIVPPSERIAAPEDATSHTGSAAEPASTTNFIAAARRAAKAAAAGPTNDKAAKAARPAAGPLADARDSSTITSKIRSLLVGASVVVIVLGTFKMAMTLLDSGSTTPPPSAIENSAEPPLSVVPPTDSSAGPTIPAPSTPSMTSPTSIGRQSLNLPGLTGPLRTGAPPLPQVAPITPGDSFSGADITGTISVAQTNVPKSLTPGANRQLTQVQVPPTEQLPDAIGAQVLRAAALKGDPSAAYEIGVRFSEGKGVPANLDEAAKWYDRAAQAGIVPAIFRLGTFYEKGLGVKKDTEMARRYYLQAAERGNAKAMHNLAVLDADGGGKGANYKSASQWFRKAADRGVSDSQFNLGILYARGIGVEQNLAESFKWFSLAAAQGDADSGRKRDDIAKRLDVQSLAAATLAIQTFVPEAQPDDAINAASPAGGWDGTGQIAGAKSAAGKAGTLKRVIR